MKTNYYSVIISSILFFVSLALLFFTTGCAVPEGDFSFSEAPTATVVPTPMPSREISMPDSQLANLLKVVGLVVVGLIAMGLIAAGLIAGAKWIAKWIDGLFEKPDLPPGMEPNAKKVERATKSIDRELKRVDANLRDIERESAVLLDGIYALLSFAAGLRALYDLYERALEIISADPIDALELAKIRGQLKPRDPIAAGYLDSPHLWTNTYRIQIAENMAELLGQAVEWSRQYVEHAAKLQRVLHGYKTSAESLRFSKNYGANAKPVLAIGQKISDALTAVMVIRGLFPIEHRSERRLADLFSREPARLAPVSKATRENMEVILGE